MFGGLALASPLPPLLVPPLSSHEHQQHQKNQHRRMKVSKKERRRLKVSKNKSHRTSKHVARASGTTDNTTDERHADALQQQVKRLRREEQVLSNSVDERIQVLSKVLPSEFLQGSIIQSYLQKNSITVLNKIANRIFNSIRKDAWKIWTEQTASMREIALQARLSMFSQQGGIRRIKRMIAKAMRGRTERMWKKWRNTTLLLRNIEQTPAATRLQSIARMFLVRNWLFKLNRSARLFQQLFRQHAARKIMRALFEHQEQNRVALLIQMRWRARCAWREVQHVRMAQLRASMASMSTMDSGSTSDFSAVARMGRRASGSGADGGDPRNQPMFQNSFMSELEEETKNLMALAMTGDISVEEVKKRLNEINQRLDSYKTNAALASLVLQRSWLGYVARCQVLVLQQRIAAATCIEASYRGYCGRQYAAATAAVAHAVVEATRHAASFSITSTWRSYRRSQMQRAALVAIAEVVQEAQRCVACMTIQDAFRGRQLALMLEDMERDMAAALDFAATHMQSIVRGHQGRVYAINCRNRTVAVCKIQRMERCHRARVFGKRIIRSADTLTRWARQTLYRARLGNLRRRVLHRWGRRRHKILRSIMSAWPGWADVGARRDKVVKWSIATRHSKRKSKQKIWRSFQKFLAMQRQTKRMYKKALQWWQRATLAKGFRTYKSHVHEIIDNRQKLLNAIAWWNKRQMIRCHLQWKLYHEWRRYRKQQYEDAAVRLNHLRKKRVVREFRRAVETRRMQLVRAAQWFFATKERQSWIQWKNYLEHRQTYHENMALAVEHASESRFHYRELTGVKRWVRWIAKQKDERARFAKAIGLWKGRQQGSAFRSWQLLVRLQKADRLAENYFRTKESSIAVRDWHEWAVNKKLWRRKLAVLSKKAAKHWKGRVAAPSFLRWKSMWQEAHAEKLARQRVSAALINRVGRGYMARRLARAKRRINELMRPLKIAREEAVEYTKANELAKKRNEHTWIAIMYYSEFLMDGDSTQAIQYKMMTAAFAGAAIDLLNNWPVVLSVKADAMSSYDPPMPPSFPGMQWSRGNSLMLGPSERLPQELPVLTLWWQGNPAMHDCKPLIFTADWTAMVEKSKHMSPEPNIPGIGQRPPLEKLVLQWYLETIKHVFETTLWPTAARDIQRVYRSKVARRRVGGLARASREICAVRVLQSAWQHWASQKLARKTRGAMSALRLRAVRLVQNAYRGFQSRDFLNIVREMLNCKPENYPRSLVCAECQERVGRQACYECDMPFCDRCFLNLHTGHHGMAFHFSVQIDYKAMDSGSFMCGNCEVRPSISYCTECEDSYCEACVEEEHSKGARALHTGFIKVLATAPGNFLIDTEELSSIAPELDIATLHTTRDALMLATRTVTGSDKNWKTTKQFLWERSDEAIRLAAEAEEKRRIAVLLEENKEEVQQIFEAFDLDHNGTIDEEEMVMVLRKVICAPLSKSEIRSMYKELDKDGDGTIDFEEFHEWYTLNIIDTSILEGRKMTKAQLKMQRNVSRMKTSMTTWVQEKMPKKVHPKVPGYDALMIRDNETEEIYMEDVKRIKPKFWWWARELYGLDKDLGASIDEQRDFTTNELEAFDMLFKRQWNTGILPVKFYHDGRRFFKKGTFWRQRWDREHEHFIFTDEANGYTTNVNPDPTASEAAARLREASAQRAGNAAQGFKDGVKNVGKMALRGAGAVGKTMFVGAGIAGKKLLTVGATYEVRTLMNLGYSRKIATRAAERAPNLAGGKPSPALMDQQLREAMVLQVEHDEKRAERAARLREEPHIGMVVAEQMTKFGRGLIDILRQRKREVLTEEDKKAAQLSALRRDLYGDGGMPSEDIDLESSDDEDAW